jgi:hypothetical protein
MYTRRRDTGVSQGGLQQLLQRLLCVEADEIVWHGGIVAELLESDLIALGLAREPGCEITQVRFLRGHVPLPARRGPMCRERYPTPQPAPAA